MAIVTITEAAELAGVSRGTLYNRLRDGTLSRTGDGVDTSELLRVFGPLQAHERVQPAAESVTSNDVSERSADVQSDVSTRPLMGVDAQLTAALTAQLEAAERERVWLRELVEAERARVIEKEAAIAERDARIATLTERITALLPAPETPPPRRPLWRRVFG